MASEPTEAAVGLKKPPIHSAGALCQNAELMRLINIREMCARRVP